MNPWVRNRLSAEGPVPFERFMEWALYHPEHGYYASGRAAPGRDEGDFTTAPQTSTLFGRCLARVVAAADRALGRPDPFVLVEGGAGEGRLARDLLCALAEREAALYERLRYAAEESGPSWRGLWEASLSDHRERVLAEVPAAFSGLYLSNELVDALPVHRLRRFEGELREVFVAADGGRLVEVLRPPSRPELAAYLDTERIEVAEGYEVEVNLRALEWLRGVARRLERGYVVTIDYGDEGHRLFGPQRPRGTSAAYRRHTLSEDLLADPGGQDLTAHVNFSALRRSGAELGLDAAPLQTQRDFLFAAGLLEEVEALEGEGLPEPELLAARRSVAPLLFPDQMGDAFHVLVQAKGAPLDAMPQDPRTAGSRLSDGEPFRLP
ncbi:MAG: SAM-dependent methyltransferase [Deltaproteobacteria bacterium]|nr:SAM-dependent methyltransferase [Deltaproteobacteria bacterium]